MHEIGCRMGQILSGALSPLLSFHGILLCKAVGSGLGRSLSWQSTQHIIMKTFVWCQVSKSKPGVILHMCNPRAGENCWCLLASQFSQNGKLQVHRETLSHTLLWRAIDEETCYQHSHAHKYICTHMHTTYTQGNKSEDLMLSLVANWGPSWISGAAHSLPIYPQYSSFLPHSQQGSPSFRWLRFGLGHMTYRECDHPIRQRGWYQGHLTAMHVVLAGAKQISLGWFLLLSFFCFVGDDLAACQRIESNRWS